MWSWCYSYWWGGAEVEYLRHPLDPDPIGSTYVKSFVGPSDENTELLSYKAIISIDEFSKALKNKVKAFCETKGLGNSILYGIFGHPIYAYKRYPMNKNEKIDADKIFFQLKDYYSKLNN